MTFLIKTGTFAMISGDRVWPMEMSLGSMAGMTISGNTHPGVGNYQSQISIILFYRNPDLTAFDLGFQSMPDGIFHQWLEQHGRKGSVP